MSGNPGPLQIVGAKDLGHVVSAPHPEGLLTGPSHEASCADLVTTEAGASFPICLEPVCASGIAAGGKQHYPQPQHKQSSVLGPFLPQASGAAPWLILTGVLVTK